MSAACENCGSHHKAEYGSGRFCGSKCARGFSTKARRSEINQRVSRTLSSRFAAREVVSSFCRPDVHAKSVSSKKEIWARELMDAAFETLSYERMRKRVLLEQENACAGCGLAEWRGQPLVLELEHTDGDPGNNARTNVEALCPNCHSITATWRGRNRGQCKRDKIPDEEFRAALQAHPTIRRALIALGLSPRGNNYVRARLLLAEDGERGGT